MTGDRPEARGRWQLGLRTTILLVVVAALGLNIARDRRVLRRLRPEAKRVELRRPAQWQLDTTDPHQVAIHNLDFSWGPGDSWEVYLPPGGRYRLCLATRVGRFKDQPTHYESIPIEPGQHLLSLDEQRVGAGWRVVATWNRIDRLAIDETGDWLPTYEFNGSGMSAHHVPLGKVVTLLYRRHGPPKSPTPSAEVPGVRLWIETEGVAGSPPPPESSGR